MFLKRTKDFFCCWWIKKIQFKILLKRQITNEVNVFKNNERLILLLVDNKGSTENTFKKTNNK